MLTPVATLLVGAEHAGRRLDQVAAALWPEYSRSRLKGWIEAGQLKVDGEVRRPKDKLAGGETVVLAAAGEVADAAGAGANAGAGTGAGDGAVEAEAISLDIVHEDAQVLVLNKPAGLVVHPGAGNRRGTLQNALLHFDAKLAALPRAGIVHRLDKETSGLMVVARTLPAHTQLTRMIEAHEVEREYEAVCVGVMTAGGTVDAPIDRHRSDRLKMAVRQGGREAITHYRVLERFRAHTHVRLQLETGRTHQIRVHMAHIHYPLVGDPVYGGRLILPKGAEAALIETLRGFRRQALHAARLAFAHPRTGKAVSFATPLPADLAGLVQALGRDARQHAS